MAILANISTALARPFR